MTFTTGLSLTKTEREAFDQVGRELAARGLGRRRACPSIEQYRAPPSRASLMRDKRIMGEIGEDDPV